MVDIVLYIKSLFSYLLGNYSSNLLLYPSDLVSSLLSIHQSAIQSDHILEYWVSSLLSSPNVIFTSFVWVWFAWFGLHLLIIWPFNWFRSIIRKCKG